MGKPIPELMAQNKSLVDAMRAELAPVFSQSSVVGSGPYHDLWLLRYAIGFGGKDHKASCEKFKKMVEFRVKYGLDEIRRKFEGGMKPHDFPGYNEAHKGFTLTFDLNSGRGRDGSPINIEATPKHKFAELFAIPPDLYDQYVIHNLEWHAFLLDTIALETNTLVGFIKIMDLEGCGMGQLKWVYKWQGHTKERRERLGVEILECYPECFGKIAVMNSPSFWGTIWGMLKGAFPARTAEKVQVVGKAKTQEVLLSLVAPEVLPSHLGGSFDGEWRMLPTA